MGNEAGELAELGFNAKICKICSELTLLRSWGGAALSARELTRVAGETMRTRLPGLPQRRQDHQELLRSSTFETGGGSQRLRI